jgi:hypothetical protein
MIMLLAVIIIAIAVYAALSGGVVTKISGPASLVLTSSPRYFSLSSGTYSVSLASASRNLSVAYVYLNRLPIFMNPLLNVTLHAGNITRVNEGSGFANIGLTLESIGRGNVTVRITQLDPALQLTPDAAMIRVVGTMLLAQPSKGSASNGITPESTTLSTTVATTTTIGNVNTTHAQIMAALGKNEFYALMLNYSTLYTNTKNCTQAVYNTAYKSYYKYAPSVANASTFYNVSAYVPYDLYTNTTSLGSGDYLVVYSTKTVDPTYNNAQALTIKVSAPTETVLNVTLAPTGIFGGEDYSILLTGYSKAKGIAGACGIEVP